MNETSIVVEGEIFADWAWVGGFSQPAFAALLATMNADETAALLDPSFSRQPWKHREAIYRRFARLHEDGSDVSVVQAVVDVLIDDSLRAASTRGSADSGLRKLLPLLPRENAIASALDFLSHRRRSRRETGRRVLVELKAFEAADELYRAGMKAGDAVLVRSALRLGSTCEDLDATLPLIGDGPAASRLIERYAKHKVESYAQHYPSAVLRFIGRTRSKQFGRLATQMLELMLSAPYEYTYFRGTSADDLIGLAFWTLGQLGLREDIVRCESKDSIERAQRQWPPGRQTLSAT